MENEIDHHYEKPRVREDRWNVLVLILLYILQFSVAGLAGAIPLILQKRKATYTDQAEFNFIWYSYCFKLLWAPIVECVYWKKMGKRKTWIIPTQYLIGIFLFVISMNVDDWLGSEDGTSKPKVRVLTAIFFVSIFFASTQDIAADGWSLTILQKRNIGYAGICPNIGFNISQFLSFVCFIVLDSKDFCNMFRSVPQDYGFVTFSNFLFYWSVLFFVSTTLILILKKEDDSPDVTQDNSDYKLGLKDTYLHLWNVLKLRPIQVMCFIMLTSSIGSAPTISVVRLKLIDAGVPVDNLTILTQVPALPFRIVLPFLLSKILTGPRSLRSYLLIYVLRLIFNMAYVLLVFLTPYAQDEKMALTTWYYWLLLLVFNLDALLVTAMIISNSAFLSRISDPKFGGMYLTLFFTVITVGFQWPSSVCLWIVDWLTVKTCIADEVGKLRKCYTVLDGFYTETILCTFLATLWLFWSKKKIYELEKLDRSMWIVEGKPNVVKDKLLMTSSSRV